MRPAEVVWALAAILPLSAVGLIAGAALQRTGVSAATRERVFSLAFWLGPTACLLAFAAHALPRPAAAEITVILRSTPLGALPQATRLLAQTPFLPRLPELLLAVAAIGAAFRLVQLGRAWLVLHDLRRKAVDAPCETLRAVRAAGLKPSVPLKLSAGAFSPIAAGLLRPEILLPERFAAPEAAALVCRHEAQHIARCDNLRLALEQLAGALLWFDPLRGAVHRRMIAAREERCDAAALHGRTSAERKLYAQTLLEELTQPPSPALAVGLIGAGKSCAVARVSAILDPQPTPKRPVLTLGLCGLLATIGAGAAIAAGQTDQSAPAWIGKVVSAVAAARSVRPITVEPASAPLPARQRTARSQPTRIADTDLAAFSEAAGGPVDGSELRDDMPIYVNGDMDVDDLNHLVFQLAASRGVQATADNRPLLEQAVLRDAADQPRVNILADSTQQFDGATRFAGNVEVAGDLKRAFDGAIILIDGLPAPPSLVLTSRLVADTVELKRRGMLADGKFLSVNIHGVRLAQ